MMPLVYDHLVPAPSVITSRTVITDSRVVADTGDFQNQAAGMIAEDRTGISCHWLASGIMVGTLIPESGLGRGGGAGLMTEG
jgi:hypothetical protein